MRTFRPIFPVVCPARVSSAAATSPAGCITMLTMPRPPPSATASASSGAAPPPAAALLGWELVSVDPGAGTIEVAFTATAQFLNPAGVVQGGLVAAMLDDTMGPALVATLGPGQFAPTTDLHVQFLRPARPGRLTGRGRVVRRGSNVAFLAGELLDESGQTVAVATATALIQASPA